MIKFRIYLFFVASSFAALLLQAGNPYILDTMEFAQSFAILFERQLDMTCSNDVSTCPRCAELVALSYRLEHLQKCKFDEREAHDLLQAIIRCWESLTEQTEFCSIPIIHYICLGEFIYAHKYFITRCLRNNPELLSLYKKCAYWLSDQQPWV